MLRFGEICVNSDKSSDEAMNWYADYMGINIWVLKFNMQGLLVSESEPTFVPLDRDRNYGDLHLLHVNPKRVLDHKGQTHYVPMCSLNTIRQFKKRSSRRHTRARFSMTPNLMRASEASALDLEVELREHEESSRRTSIFDRLRGVTSTYGDDMPQPLPKITAKKPSVIFIIFPVDNGLY